MTNGDSMFTWPPARNEPPDIIVERQLSLTGEHQHAHRCELLRDRRGVEDGRRGDRDGEIEVGRTVATLVHDDTIWRQRPLAVLFRSPNPPSWLDHPQLPEERDELGGPGLVRLSGALGPDPEPVAGL